MKKAITLLFVIAVYTANAQPLLSWQKSYGGSDHEYTWKTIPITGGGYAFVGFSDSNDGDVSGNHGNTDLWVAKIDASGTIVWSYLYGGTEDEEGTDIIQTQDGGFMVVGWTDSQDGDVTGHLGTYGSDFWLLKITSAGALTWAKCYGGTSDDDASAIVESQTGNYYISGTTYSYDGDVSGNHGTYETDFWVIKVNAAGTLLSQKCVGGSEYEEGINMTLTNDNGCALIGRSYSTDGDVSGYHAGSDMMVAKLDSSFNISWANCFGGSETEEGNSIVQLADNSFAALGYTSTHNNGDVTGHHGSQGSDDFWLVKINTNGTLNWEKCYGGDGDDQANGLVKTLDGGYVMTGLTNSVNGDVAGFHNGGFFEPDFWVAKTDASGTFQWQRCCGGSGQDEAFNVFEEGSGTYVVTGFSYSADYDVTVNKGSADGWIIKVTGGSGIAINNDENSILFWPNPAKDRIFVDASKINEIRISDLSGKLIWYSKISEDGVLIIPSINPGLYFAEFSGYNFKAIRKLEVF